LEAFPVNGPAMLIMLVRNFAFLSLVGFLAVVLIGPVLAVLGVMFSFAVIGLVFWIPFRLLILGQPVDWARYRDLSRRYAGPVFSRCRHLGRLGHGYFDQGRECYLKARATGRYLLAIARETTCGMLVGGLVGLMNSPPYVFPQTIEHGLVWPGMLVGAAVGALVGLASRRPAREPA
jgi:hypothetical protein